jgi:hypothetical protein
MIEITVVSKAPPGGRCEFYDRVFFELVRSCENVKYTLVPANLYEGEVNPPAVLINGKEVAPEDGILLTPEEMIASLKKEGARFRVSEEEVLGKLRDIYEKLMGG